MSHGANAAFVECRGSGRAARARSWSRAPGSPRPRRSRPGPAARPRRPSDADQRAEALPLAAADRTAPLGRDDRRAGLFWPDVPRARGAPEAVEAELRGQIETALPPASTRPISTPIWARRRCRSSPLYRRLGREYRLPVLLGEPRALQPGELRRAARPAPFDAEVAAARAAGEPVFDIVLETPWGRDRRRDRLPRDVRGDPGRPHLPLHALQPARRLRDHQPQAAHLRTEEYALFRTPVIKRGWRSSGWR